MASLREEDLHGELWPYVLTLLPPDLETHAREAKALRRARGVKSAADLLRLFLAYGVTPLSLAGVAAWATAAEVASISAPALFYRLRDGVEWLSRLLASVLADTLKASPDPSGYRVRIVDATSISRPGSEGTDWRVHVLADPSSGKLAAVDITDVHGGEGFARHPLGPGDLVLGDRGYAHARGIAAAKRAGADVVVRINLATLRLCDSDHQRLAWQELEARVPVVGAIDLSCEMPEPPATWNSHKTWPLHRAASWTAVRLIGVRPRAGHVVWILTTATKERLSAAAVTELYRLRWQIELLFKRLKSLLAFDQLPARTEPLARAWLLSRLLAAALVERLTYVEPALSPWGYCIRTP